MALNIFMELTNMRTTEATQCLKVSGDDLELALDLFNLNQRNGGIGDWRLEMARKLSKNLGVRLESCKSVLAATGYDSDTAASILLDNDTDFIAPDTRGPLGGILPVETTAPINAVHRVHAIQPTRHFDPTNVLDNHFRIAEGMFLRNGKAGKYRVTQVDYHVNPVLIRQFAAKQRQLDGRAPGGEAVILAFHGTRDPANVASIAKNNFDRTRIGTSTGCAHGRGFYFSEFPDVSLGYGTNLLLCQVLVGRTYDERRGDNFNGKPLMPGYDSHRFQADQGGYGNMIIVADPDQILPSYVLHIGQ